MASPQPVIRIQREDFDLAAEIARLSGDGAGAVATFTGICRDEAGRLAALELEHYPGMAEAEIGRIAIDAAEPGTMERLLSDAGASPMFVDLLNQPQIEGTRWMYEPMLSRDASISGPQAMLPVLIVPREQYDGVLLIDRVSAPRFLSR